MGRIRSRNAFCSVLYIVSYLGGMALEKTESEIESTSFYLKKKKVEKEDDMEGLVCSVEI